jgi:hypothetical protein
MMVALLFRQRLGGCGALGDFSPCDAAGLLGSHRFACERFREHLVDLGPEWLGGRERRIFPLGSKIPD